MRVPFRDIGIVHVRIGDHRLFDLVKVNNHLGGIAGIGIGGQRRSFTRPDFGNALVGNANQAMQHQIIIFHALVDHDLDAVLGNFQRFNQRVIFGNADRCLGLHLGGPVGEGERLIGQQCADMHLDDAALKHVVTKLLQHL